MNENPVTKMQIMLRTVGHKTKLLKNQLFFQSLLVKQHAIVRQTIRFAVRKRTRHHGQIQLRNAIFIIVLSLGKKGGEEMVSPKKH